ncbi:hypothetical protein [uncultured Jannaschia sp.]|uniref:hypothetical protein n=1 Tax=uncultured Jannaschia sp. TaxID=293347 RepID=UPI0026248865|nr:hypothetical protein [uncultured Jannaschia sp.]
MNRMHVVLMSAILAFAGPAGAQSLEDWDADGSGAVSQQEWTTGLDILGLFSDWDADGSGIVDEGEFAGGLFGRFDQDGDGALTASEWDDGIDAWYGEEAVDLDFDAWNSDDDDMLSADEFTDSFRVSDLYERFAAEANITDPASGIGEDAFAPALFDWFDADDDQEIAPGESAWFG